jgi:hypothetical protein
MSRDGFRVAGSPVVVDIGRVVFEEVVAHYLLGARETVPAPAAGEEHEGREGNIDQEEV